MFQYTRLKKWEQMKYTSLFEPKLSYSFLVFYYISLFIGVIWISVVSRASVRIRVSLCHAVYKHTVRDTPSPEEFTVKGPDCAYKHMLRLHA